MELIKADQEEIILNGYSAVCKHTMGFLCGSLAPVFCRNPFFLVKSSWVGQVLFLSAP